jgi:hypothetical protein
MSEVEYTYCPGEDCVRKVVVWSLPDGQLGVNFCCVDCWNYTYALMLQDFGAGGDATEDELFHGHSAQCVKRAQQRETAPVTELATYVIMGPSHHQAIRDAHREPPVSAV